MHILFLFVAPSIYAYIIAIRVLVVYTTLYLCKYKLKGNNLGTSKGIIIAASRQIVRVHNEEVWLVESETTDGKFYKVSVDGQCECPDSRIRSQTCKHVYSVIRWATE